MGFKKLVTLDTDTMVTLGGQNKATGENNPTSVEGYFLATQEVGKNKFNKSKTDYKHIIQTKKGNVGVWGKTHMDRQMLGVAPGTMVRISYNGTKDVGKGNDMTLFLVEVDEDNTITLSFEANVPVSAKGSDSEDLSDADLEYGDESEEDEDDQPADEISASRPSRPQKAAQAPSAAQQAKVKALLGGKSRSA